MLEYSFARAQGLLSQVLAFLEAFTEEYGLRPLIRFDTRVVNMEPLHRSEYQQENTNGLPSKGRESPIVHSPPQWVITSEPVSTLDGQVIP